MPIIPGFCSHAKQKSKKSKKLESFEFPKKSIRLSNETREHYLPFTRSGCQMGMLTSKKMVHLRIPLHQLPGGAVSTYEDLFELNWELR